MDRKEEKIAELLNKHFGKGSANVTKICRNKYTVIFDEAKLKDFGKNKIPYVGEQRKELERNMLAYAKMVLNDKCDVDPDVVKPDARLREDCYIDSLDRYEVLYAIESELGVTIADEAGIDFEKIQDVIDYLIENSINAELDNSVRQHIMKF